VVLLCFCVVREVQDQLAQRANLVAEGKRLVMATKHRNIRLSFQGEHLYLSLENIYSLLNVKFVYVYIHLPSYLIE